MGGKKCWPEGKNAPLRRRKMEEENEEPWRGGGVEKVRENRSFPNPEQVVKPRLPSGKKLSRNTSRKEKVSEAA